MKNEQINTYTNISGRTQSVYTDWGNAVDIVNNGTVNIYESIGDALVDAGLFTLTAEDAETAVTDRSMSEVNTDIDALEEAIGTETDVTDLRSDLNDVIVSLISDETDISNVIVSLIQDESDIAGNLNSIISDETRLDSLEAIVTLDGIDNTLLNFGTVGNQIGGKDILYDGGGGITYKLLLTGGTIVIEQV